MTNTGTHPEVKYLRTFGTEIHLFFFRTHINCIFEQLIETHNEMKWKKYILVKTIKEVEIMCVGVCLNINIDNNAYNKHLSITRYI